MARLITVANRLPFSLGGDGKQLITNSGGLVSALSGAHLNQEKIWAGCAPDTLTPETWPEIEASLSGSEWRYHPIFVPKEQYDLYYNGCCNDVLWPLLHYQAEFVDFSTETWQAYREINQRIADELASIAEPDDLIWIHDFHLFLVPRFLREKRPELRTGFFLHVPFPSSEVFRQLPVREEILSSLLDADLIGFHDYSYLHHFCATVLRLLGIDSSLLVIEREGTPGHTTRLGVFPVSIDTAQFESRSRDPDVRELSQSMTKPYFQFLGVDRLDYIKGLDLKLKAFAKLLRHNPDLRENVGLLQVAVPTRTEVPVYQKLAQEIAQLIGEINGEFSTPNWTPIQYIHSSVSNADLIALYRSADALIVTSKRDGMNLVALEYVASQDVGARPGVILLSEFTGAVSALSQTLSINPWDLDGTAEKMLQAIHMPREQRIFRLRAMQEQLRNYTSTDWAGIFIQELLRSGGGREEGPSLVGPEKPWIDTVSERILLTAPERIAIFLDYDGTLVPIQPTPELAVLTPSGRGALERILERHQDWMDLIVVSGRDSDFIFTQMGDLALHAGLHLAAEHGAKYFDPQVGHWQRRIHRKRATWYPTALKIMSDYAARVPGSRVEKKTYAIAWHYRQSPPEFAEFQALKLAEELELGLANLPVSIIRGKRVIEVRASEADKGVFANSFLDNHAEDTIALAFGDDRTDEDLFNAVKGRGFSFKVGAGSSSADFAIGSQSQLLLFLERLLQALAPKMRAAAKNRPPAQKEQPKLKSTLAGNFTH
jgi:trehalose 6-phosphate synthase/phosphatase